MKSKTPAFLTALLGVLLGIGHPVHAQQNTPDTVAFGGAYSSLHSKQKRFVDDWFQRLSAVVQKPLDPAEDYERIPLSQKTTFNAVTHALLMTKLTDASGKQLAESSVDLVDKIDNVAGQVPGSGGDHQFRIYVQMKPGVLELLNQSKEFHRGQDNTVYHKGYPICFRSTNGTPSIQISLTQDATRADIDVDYRSPKFPVFLANGHLTSSNSDVRAGDNDVRHNTEWAGLQNWWRNLLGFPLLEAPPPTTEPQDVLPQQPRVKAANPADAVFDFLNGWLVEQKPNEAIAHVAQQAYACMQVESGTRVDYGMAKFSMLVGMRQVNEAIGRVPSLDDASIGVAVAAANQHLGERLKLIAQPHRSQFVLYDVREDLAERFRCTNKLDASQISAKAMRSTSFGKYVGAIFQIKGRNQTGTVVATLWQRVDGFWKMISYDVDPEADRNAVPNVGAPLPVDAPLEYVSGDKEMIRSASDFLMQWIVKRDIGKAMDYIAPECLRCVDVYRPDDQPAPSTPEEARALLRKNMTSVTATIGPVTSLDDAIIAAQPNHQALKLVMHGDDKAFAVVSIPGYMGDAADCGRRNAAGDPDFSPSDAATGYGTYYAAGFSLKEGEADPSVLWILWSRVSGSWKAVSYVLLTP